MFVRGGCHSLFSCIPIFLMHNSHIALFLPVTLLPLSLRKNVTTVHRLITTVVILLIRTAMHEDEDSRSTMQTRPKQSHQISHYWLWKERVTPMMKTRQFIHPATRWFPMLPGHPFRLLSDLLGTTAK